MLWLRFTTPELMEEGQERLRFVKYLVHHYPNTTKTFWLILFMNSLNNLVNNMRLKENVSEKTYTQEELRSILRFFIEDTRADEPWVDADDEWFEQFLQQNPINKS
jgi:hypothetical protein